MDHAWIHGDTGVASLWDFTGGMEHDFIWRNSSHLVYDDWDELYLAQMVMDQINNIIMNVKDIFDHIIILEDTRSIRI